MSSYFIKKPLHLPLFSLLLALLPVLAQAQTRHQVATRKVEKTFPYREGYELNLEGEKAEVTIETWERDEISVVVELSAKHPDKAKAQEDLERIQFQAERVKNRIYVRNYVSTKEGEKAPEAVLDATYLIKVPSQCPVYLKNRFGEANITNLARQLRINSSFTRLGLQNIQGTVDVSTRFGDLTGTNLDGIVTVNARRSNVTLSELRGQYDLNIQYGILKLMADQALANLRINAEHSDVFLYSPNPRLFAYDIQSTNSDLTLPNGMGFKFMDSNTEDLKKASFKPQTEYFAKITITIRFGDLIVSRK